MLDLALISLAFVAGLVTFLNPCGIAMLPAYVSLYLGSKSRKLGAIKSILKGIAIGIVISVGFLFVFVSAGALISLLGSKLVYYTFYLNFPISIFLIILGLMILLGKTVSFGIKRIPVLDQFNPASEIGFRSMFLYGVLYAIVSLGCTLPIFLTIALSAITTGDFFAGIANFLAFSSGMGIFMIVV